MASNETQVYKANCHCRQVKMSVVLLNLLTARVNRCNCSICTRNGYLFVYPKREHVSFLCGEDKLSAYRFGNRRKPHMFCPNCGTSMFIDFRESDREDERDEIGFNIRTIENIEDILPKLDIGDFDGKRKLGPEYGENSNAV